MTFEISEDEQSQIIRKLEADIYFSSHLFELIFFDENDLSASEIFEQALINHNNSIIQL